MDLAVTLTRVCWRQVAMNERERLLAGADALEEAARWSEQPDEPTGCWAVLSAHDLYMRAAAKRAEAEVMHS